MAKEPKWVKRDKKQRKARYGMKIDGASVKLLEQIKKDKAEKARKED